MPFHRIKNEKGQWENVSVPFPWEKVKEVEDLNPQVTLQVKKDHSCTACGKKMATAGVMAMHFKRDHKELYTSDKAWREYDSYYKAAS